MATSTSNGVVTALSLSGSDSVDSLLATNKRGGAPGTGVSLTYGFRSSRSFYSTADFAYGPNPGPGEPWGSCYLMPSVQKAAVRAVLEHYTVTARYSTRPGMRRGSSIRSKAIRSCRAARATSSSR